MDYRNVCYFVIFILSLFSYKLLEDNKKLMNLCEEQDATIEYLKKTLIIYSGQYYYVEPKSENSPVH